MSCIPAPTKPLQPEHTKQVSNTWKGVTTTPAKKAPATGKHTPGERKKQAQGTDANVPDKEARSRSPAKTEPDHTANTQPSQQATTSVGGRMPASPPEAIAQGWIRQDAGGDGDCAFRSIAAARNYAQHGAQLTAKQASLTGAEMRSAAVAHARKHKARLGEWFAPDPNETEGERAGLPTVTTFDDWCSQMEHQHVWADGLTLQCLSERYGFGIVVWKKDEGGGAAQWTRYTFAPKWSNDTATTKRAEKPLTLLLESKHYTALHAPAKARTPKPWLLRTHNTRTCILIDLTGAGKSLCSNTPSSLHTYRTHATTTNKPPGSRAGSKSRPATPEQQVDTQHEHRVARTRTLRDYFGDSPERNAGLGSSQDKSRPGDSYQTQQHGTMQRAAITSSTHTRPLTQPQQHQQQQDTAGFLATAVTPHVTGKQRSLALPSSSTPEQRECATANTGRARHRNVGHEASLASMAVTAVQPQQHTATPPTSTPQQGPALTLSEQRLQQHQQQQPDSDKVDKKTFPCTKERKLLQAKGTNEWQDWVCPVCEQTVQIRGWNGGAYWRGKHLQMCHGLSLKSCQAPGRQNNTWRACVRAKQMQQMQPSGGHELVHVHTAGLKTCVPAGSTWICKKCMVKCTTSKMHNTQCLPQKKEPKRAKWMSLDLNKQKLLQTQLGLSQEQVQHFTEAAQQTLAASKPRTKTEAEQAKDKAYRERLKDQRRVWRAKQGISNHGPTAAGAANALTRFTPVPPKRANRRPSDEPQQAKAANGAAATAAADSSTPDSSTGSRTTSSSATNSRKRQATLDKSGQPTPRKHARKQEHQPEHHMRSSEQTQQPPNSGVEQGRRATKPDNSPSAWLRDLTEEGVEPHPGPLRDSDSGSQRTKILRRERHQQLTLWQVNIRSYNQRGKDVLTMAAEDNVAVVMMQETRLSDAEAAAVTRSIKQDWQLHHQAGKSAGGVAIAVRAGLPSAKVKGEANDYGEWLQVAIQGANVLSVYRRPGCTQDQMGEWNDSLCQQLATTAGPWIAAGDYNEDPREDALNVIAPSLFAHIEYVPTASVLNENDSEDEIPTPEPTRWQGNRGIDWAMVKDMATEHSLRAHKFADHKVVEHTWTRSQASQVAVRRLAPSAHFKKPEHLSDAEWEDMLEKGWNHGQAANWAELQQQLSSTYLQAFRKAYQGRQDQPRLPRKTAKGDAPSTCLVTQHHRARCSTDQTVNTTQLRRMANRHWEYHQYHSHRRGPATRALQHKLQQTGQRHGCPHDVTSQQQQQQVQQWIDEQLTSRETQQRQHKIQA